MIIQSATADPDFLTTPHLVGFRDDFESSGNINGRSGWTPEARSGFSGQLNALSAASGAVGGTTGTAMYGWHQSTDPAARATCIIGSAITQTSGTAGSISDHISLSTGTPSMFQFNHIWLTSGGVSTGRITFAHLKNTTVGTTIVQINNLRFERGDRFTRVWTSGGIVTPYLNGRQCWPAVDVSAHVGPIGTGVPLNGKFGLIGSVGAETWLDFWEASQDQGWISARITGRTVRINADGGGDWLIPISYNGVIGRVDFGLFDASDESEAVAWTQVDTTGDVVDFSTVSADMPSTFYVVLRRHLGNGNYAYARGPVQRLGPVFAGLGQSLEDNVNRQGTSTSVTGEANCWRIDGQTDETDVSKRRQLPVGNDLVPAHFTKAFGDIANLPCTIVAGGKSSTSTTERLPGTDIYNALLDGIDHAGGRVSLFFDTGGQNDTASPSTYKANMITTYEALQTHLGEAVKCVINPMNKSWTNSDSAYQGIRRAQWELCQERPDLFVYGSHVLDLRNLNDLHLATSSADSLGSNAIFAQRRGANAGRVLGYTAADYRGPRMTSVTRNSATEVYVLFDLDSFDSLELINAVTEFHGGLRFSASTNPASPIWPTAATVDASPSGGNQGVTFTFASGSFPTSVSVWCGYGANPHNPTQNATINSTTWDTAASTLRGVKSGLPSVGVQPYHGATVDYITAT